MDGGNNLTWRGLVTMLDESEDEDAKVAFLFDLLGEYLTEVQSHG